MGPTLSGETSLGRGARVFSCVSCQGREFLGGRGGSSLPMVPCAHCTRACGSVGGAGLEPRKHCTTHGGAGPTQKKKPSETSGAIQLVTGDGFQSKVRARTVQ